MAYIGRPAFFFLRAAIALGCLLSFGCAAPKAELAAYRSQFDTVRRTAEDLILGTKTAATELADDPNSPASVADRTRKLKERLDALDVRLEALRVVAQYNDALTRLAAGEDSAAVKASLDSFSTSLNSLNIPALTRMVASAAPYGPLIAAGIALVDKQIQARRFAAAIEAGEEPVIKILEILSLDATNILNIEKDRLLLRADPHKEAMKLLSLRFGKLANAHAFSETAAANRLKSLVAAHDAMTRGVASPFTREQSSAGAGQDDLALEALASINDEIKAHADAVASINSQIQAQTNLITEYQKTLASTQEALRRVRAAMNSGRSAAVMSFINDVYSLRQAYLAAAEAKNK